MTSTMPTNTIEFFIPAEHEKKALNRIERIRAQAANLGVAWAPLVTVEHNVAVAREDGEGVQLRTRIHVIAPEIDLGAWRVIATADLLANGTDGNAVVRALGGRAIPADAWAVSDVCEHCTWRRKRHTMYVLEHRETHEIKRVGSSCLGDFLGAGTELGLVDALAALLVWGETQDRVARALNTTEPARYLLTEALAVAAMHSHKIDTTESSKLARLLGVTSWRHDFAKVEADDRELAMVISDWCMGLGTAPTEYERNLAALYNQVALTAEELAQHMERVCSALGAFTSWSKDPAAFRKRMDAWQAARSRPARLEARFKLLRSGAWGVVVNSESVRRGDEVTATRRNGETSVETIEKVIWRGNGEAICAIVR